MNGTLPLRRPTSVLQLSELLLPPKQITFERRRLHRAELGPRHLLLVQRVPEHHALHCALTFNRRGNVLVSILRGKRHLPVEFGLREQSAEFPSQLADVMPGSRRVSPRLA